MHFKLVNTKYSHPLCYDFTLRMILMFQYESGNNTGIAEEISLKTSLKTQLQVRENIAKFYWFSPGLVGSVISETKFHIWNCLQFGY